MLRRRVRAAVDARGRGGKAALARAMGLSQPWATGYLNGKHDVPLKKLERVAAFCGLPVEESIGPDLPRHTDVPQDPLTGGAREAAVAARLLAAQEDRDKRHAAELRRIAAELLALAADDGDGQARGHSRASAKARGKHRRAG